MVGMGSRQSNSTDKVNPKANDKQQKMIWSLMESNNEDDDKTEKKETQRDRAFPIQ